MIIRFTWSKHLIEFRWTRKWLISYNASVSTIEEDDLDAAVICAFGFLRGAYQRNTAQSFGKSLDIWVGRKNIIYWTAG